MHSLGNLPPSGQYEVDVTALEPGPHLFIINFDDGYGKSVMKIYPFSIGTGTYSVCMCVHNSTRHVHHLATGSMNSQTT